MLLGALDDTAHHLHCLARIKTCRRFRGEHHRVDAIVTLRFDAKDAVDVPRTSKLAAPAMANSAPGKEEREINAAEAVPLATPSQTDQAHIHIQTVIAYSRCRTRRIPFLGCP